MRWTKWLKREFTDRKVRGSNPTSATRLPLSRLGQPDSIPALVLPSSGLAVRLEARWSKWLEREFSDRKFRGSNPTSASLDFPCLGWGNLVVSQPSCFLQLA
ncbi:hypothetical protein T265_02398 [Opisthorchis viverrini]|uniref:Uncharacterized protein n=1 Tax=Opisthorchis viverrini TaxID=6198 RepID=A0A074ZZB5_OPIVI|nr:hypothetical protein T265_02398 [Opisthorchis viverrini]KER31347.1 hypothetical protein T265_02398 [Opisthorchis viverrini]